ncbi:MAG: formyltransferase family protein [Ginsengibacter sp.]
MTICIAGKNQIAIEAVSYLLAKYPQYNYVACINQTDDGVNSWQPSFRSFCIANQISILDLKDLYSLGELLFISLEYDRLIIPENFLDARLYNIHFSKLPAYKGMYTSVFPLLNGEIESGVTLHLINRGIDTGPVIDQLTFPLSINTNAAQLYDLYLQYSSILFKRNIESLIAGDIYLIPQTAGGSTYFSKSSLNFSKIEIDLNKTAYEIHNQVRAYSFRQYQLPLILSKMVYKSQMSEEVSEGKPGTHISSDNEKIRLNTIDYIIDLYIDREEDIVTSSIQGDIATFEEIKKTGYPVKIRTKEGWDALIVACYHNQHFFAAHLIKSGWDINTSNYKGTTAIMYAMTAAVEGKGFESFQMLIKKADLKLNDFEGHNIFYYADKYNITEILQLLNRKKIF